MGGKSFAMSPGALRLQRPVMKKILLSCLFVVATGVASAAEKPNVLFIPIDDLNHWIGHFGRNKQTITPNLDRLAKMGVSFTNAHGVWTRR